MPAFICVTCGVQHAESDTPPDRCAICDDERQYVNFAGQQWTTLDDMKAKYENYLNEVEPGLTMIGTRPGFGIGQHAFLVHTGNVLWDCCSCIDDATVAAVEALGGVSAIAISHPHFYATCVEWSRALGDVPVFLHADDRDWVMRPDACIVRWDGEVHELADGITIVRGGGHFAGCSMLHWAGGADGKGVVLGSDTIAVGYDRKSAMWMYSFVNFIPLTSAKVWETVEAIRPFAYDRLYTAWPSRVIGAGAKDAIQASAERYVRGKPD